MPPPTGESRAAALEAAHKAGETADRAIHDVRASHHKLLRRFQLDRTVRPDDLQKANRRLDDVTKKGHAEVKRIVENAKNVLREL